MEYILIGVVLTFVGTISVFINRNGKLKKDLERLETAFKEQNKEDMLVDIFNRQIELQKKWVNVKLPGNHPKYMVENIIGIVAEIGEVLQEDKTWKSWCKNPPKVDYDKKKKEIADFFHFAVNFCIYADMDAKELYKYYIGENEKNKKRQINNY